jgi:hypothetical protein
MDTTSRTLKQKVIQQMKEFLFIALYLWLVFGLLLLYKSVILGKYHIDFASHGFALINALALGKVMLVAKDLHLGRRFNNAPLIYPTLVNSAIFTVVLVSITFAPYNRAGVVDRRRPGEGRVDFVICDLLTRFGCVPSEAGFKGTRL